MRLRTVFSLIILAVFGAGLAACGGGSVSSGGGSGSGGTGASSSIVAQTSARTASALDFQKDPRQATGLAAIFSDFLIRDATAQVEGEQEVTLIHSDGTQESKMTVDGEAVFVVEPGDYIVCFGEFTDPEVDENCGQVNIDDDDVVVVSQDEQFQVTVQVFDAEDDIVEDPNSPGNANKIIVCHKGKFELSVAGPAHTGHMAHGDTNGPCESAGEDDDNIESASDNNGRRGPPDNAGRPDNAGPPNGDEEA